MSDLELQAAFAAQDREIRIAAALAAGSAWAGISVIHDHDEEIIKTARKIEEYIKNG